MLLPIGPNLRKRLSGLRLRALFNNPGSRGYDRGLTTIIFSEFILASDYNIPQDPIQLLRRLC